MREDGWKELKSGAAGDATKKLRERLLYDDGARTDEQGRPVDRYGDPIKPDGEDDCKGLNRPPHSHARGGLSDEDASRRYGASVQAHGTAAAPSGESGGIAGVPVKHLGILLVLLAIAFVGWLFRAEVRGVAAWGMALARGENARLDANAPGLSRLLHMYKPYSREEFLALCCGGDLESVRRVLEKQPELQQPGPGGETLLHALAGSNADPKVLAFVARGSGGAAQLNARDQAGRTPLHLAAASDSDCAVALTLRGLGADPLVRDKDGRTAVRVLLENWGGMPRSITREERGKFDKYGYRVRDPFGREKNASKFVSIASQVDGLEGKRYFTLLAEARIRARDAGVTLPMAAGDVVGPPPDPMADIMRNVNDPMGRSREKAAPLWKSLSLREGSGAAMAKLKCLLPEAYPGSIGYFSTLLDDTRGTGAAQKGEAPLSQEWGGWDIPPAARLALLMQALRERLPQKQTGPRPPFAGSDAATNAALASVRERGDSADARDPLLLAWLLLDSEDGQRPASIGKKNLRLDISAADLEKDPSRPGDEKKNREELSNLRALRAALPPELWRGAGQVLVASAYAAEKRGERFLMLPKNVKEAGGPDFIRTWGCLDRKDQSAPLTRVLDLSAGADPDLAAAMVALVLRSGPRSAVRDKDGTSPLEYARKKGAPASVLALLEKAPQAPATVAPEVPAPKAAPERPGPGSPGGSQRSLRI